MELIYHIMGADEWTRARQQGYVDAASLAGEGFIHCSRAHQVAGVIARYFPGRNDLVRLEIDPALLEAPLRFEHAASVGEDFPHVYGMINLSAVREAVKL